MQAELNKHFDQTKGLLKPRDWLNKINFIKQSLLLNNAIMVVMADEEGGKTSFVHLFLEENFEDINFVALDAKGLTCAADLLKKIGHLFSEPALHNLASMVELIQQNQKHVALILDNAHELSVELLQELVATAQPSHSENYFHICLVANYAINHCFNLLDIEDFAPTIQTITLGNLTENETKTFISREIMNECRGQFIDDQHAKSFFNLTGGNISLINKHLPALKKKFQSSAPKKNKIEQVALSCCAIVTVAASVYIWQNLPYVSTVYHQVTGSNLLIANNSEAVLNSTQTYESKIPSYNIAAKYSNVQPPPLNELFNIPDDEDEALEKMAVVDSVVKVPKSLHRYIVLPQAMHRKNATSSVAEDITTPVAVQESSTFSGVLASSIASLKTLPRVAKKIAIKSPKNTHPLKQTLNKETNYTIQLLASKNKWDAKHYLAKHPAQSTRLKTWQTHKNGESWFVVTLGQFNERQAALAAVKKLPNELASAHPWVRDNQGLKRLS